MFFSETTKIVLSSLLRRVSSNAPRVNLNHPAGDGVPFQRWFNELGTEKNQRFSRRRREKIAGKNLGLYATERFESEHIRTSSQYCWGFLVYRFCSTLETHVSFDDVKKFTEVKSHANVPIFRRFVVGEVRTVLLEIHFRS